MARHYAPRVAAVSLFIGAPAAQRAAMLARAAVEAEAGRRVALLVPAEDAAGLAEALRPAAAGLVTVAVLGARGDLAAAARDLYASLRRLDDAGFAVILAADLGAAGLGAALRDRLSRAAEGRVIRV